MLEIKLIVGNLPPIKHFCSSGIGQALEFIHFKVLTAHIRLLSVSSVDWQRNSIAQIEAEIERNA